MYITKLNDINKGDDYAVHKVVKEFFPDEPRPLFQIRGACVNVLSKDRPVKLGRYDETQEVSLSFTKGEVRLITMRLNATRRDDNKKYRGLIGDDFTQWLQKKSEESGFSMIDMRVEHEGNRVSQKEGMMITISSTFVFGMLKVEDPDKFLETVCKGLGRAKGLGFGMLDIFS